MFAKKLRLFYGETDFPKGVRNLKIEKILFVAPNPNRGPGKYKPLFPPLALMQLAALTPPDIKVEIADESVRAINFDEPTGLVGISVSMSAVRPRAIEIAREFCSRRVPVVFGGVDPTFAFEECAQESDYVFRGEAEGGWVDFLKLLCEDKAPKIFRAKPMPDLFLSPLPVRGLLRPQDYAFFNTVQTGRGCPHNCEFCSVWAFSGRKLRFRSIGNVIEEIKTLPPGVIVFVDDNIIADFERSLELFRALKPLGRRWFAQADTSFLERPDLVELAAKSGCVVLFIGFESFAPESLKLVNKSFNDVARYRELVGLLHRYGIGIIPAMIFGFDSDTQESFRKTERALDRMKADAPQFSVLTPLPGTVFYRKMQNRLLTDDLSRYDGTKAVFQPAKMSAETLETGVTMTYHRYYRPTSIVRRLVMDPWFWRHPLRRLRLLGCLLGKFAPRIWNWVKLNKL